jgi:hypothetical protein
LGEFGVTAPLALCPNRVNTGKNRAKIGNLLVSSIFYPVAHFFFIVFGCHRIELKKLPILGEFGVAAPLALCSNRVNTGKNRAKIGNLLVFSSFYPVAHFFFIVFGCHRIELKKLPILGEFDVAATLASWSNWGNWSPSNKSRPF